MAGTDGKQTPAQAARLAREQVEELFGMPVEAVSAISRVNGDGGGWAVTLELLELPRIPDTTSVLGSYEAVIDGNGDLIEAKRVRRYARNQTDTQQQQRGGEQ
jgi:hypothetical protein